MTKGEKPRFARLRFVVKWFCLLACVPLVYAWYWSTHSILSYDGVDGQSPVVVVGALSDGGVFLGVARCHASDEAFQLLLEAGKPNYKWRYVAPETWHVERKPTASLHYIDLECPWLPSVEKTQLSHPCAAGCLWPDREKCPLEGATFTSTLFILPLWVPILLLLLIASVLFHSDYRRWRRKSQERRKTATSAEIGEESDEKDATMSEQREE